MQNISPIFFHLVIGIGILANIFEIIRYSNKLKKISVINIYLIVIVCILYYNYMYSHSFTQLIGMLAITYCSIVIILNRIFRFSNRVNAVLYLPFITSIAYFIALII